MKTETAFEARRMTEAINFAVSRKLIYVDATFRARARRALARNRKEPGDCAGDGHMLLALAIAEAEVGRRAGWIPEVQRIAYEIAKHLDTVG